MAVRHGYGKIAGADALVFAYDTGDTRNSYKGEPTVNLANTENKRTMANYGGGTVTTAEAPEKGPGWKKITITALNGSNFRLAKFPYINHPTNTTRTYSLELDFNNTSGYYVRGDGYNGMGPNITTSGVHSWTKVTTTTSGNMALFLNSGASATTGLNDVIYYRYHQVEDKAHRTQFTEGTRSATEGLKDLTGNNSIDLNTVSFDSNAQMTFDGTDDKAEVANFPHIWDGSLSLETVVSWNDNSRSIIFGNYNVGANDVNFEKLSSGTLRFYWNRGERDVTASAAVTYAGANHHVTFVRDKDSNSFKFYVDGELVQTTSNVGTDISSTGSTFRIGADTRNGDTVHNGDIPVLKLYNRALTTAEVKNNYNHYKNRFDI